MKKIKLWFDYKCFPIWFYDEDGLLIVNDSPKDLRNDEILNTELLELQKIYNNLYIDTTIEFKYIGFANENIRSNFEMRVAKAYLKIQNFARNKYETEIKNYKYSTKEEIIMREKKE